MIKKLIPFLKKYKKAAIIGPLFVVADIIAEVNMPKVMSMIVDIGIVNRDVSYIIKMGLLMIFLGVFAMAAGSASVYFSSVASQGFGCEVRKGLFAKIQKFAFSNIDDFSTSSLITRITSDTTSVQQTLMQCLRLLTRTPLMLIGALIMAMSINKQLGIVLVVAIPIIGVIIAVLLKIAFPLFIKTQQKLDNVNSSVQENLTSIRIVKSFVRATFEKIKFKKSVDEYTQVAIKAFTIMIIAMPLMSLAINIASAAILWFGGNLIVSGVLKAGELISFLTYIVQILISLVMLSMVVLMLARSKASAARIVEVLDKPLDMQNLSNHDAALVVKSGKVEFCDVSFKYNKTAQENVLSNINFVANPGQVVAIVGSTGSAKSTLVSLIPRLYDVTQGHVLVDGHDVREFSIENLRNGIGVVLQNNILFSGTIEQNIKWGNPQATHDQVLQAAKDAQAHEFIMSFPQGYDSHIDQGGVNVSGGQKQRLCIARAMIKKPKILILDDSTSAVDSATEALIRKSFYENLKETTVFLIAQRISSVAEADNILVVDDGKIIACGKHSQLLQTSNVYKEIYTSQLEGKGVAQ